MRFGWSPKDSSARIRGMAKIGAVLFIVIYAIIYLAEPFSETWNSILANALLVIASSLTATIATLIWARFEETDTPRRIWRYFSVGLWLWAIAELTWGYLNVNMGEVPEGIADVFWVGAYIFFAHALYIQYRLLVNPTPREALSRLAIVIASFLVIYALVYRVMITWGGTERGFGAAVNSFYPVADLFLAVIAVWLVRHFRGGAFARPWLGLLAFSFTDLLYAWIEVSGIYSWSVNQANIWSAVFDIAYVGAYLVLGLGILSQWAFLKYGLLSSVAE